MKQDQMSMAASIESRVPFLDDRLVEHVAALPGDVKLPGWQTKALLRAAVQRSGAAADPDAPEDGISGADRPLAARRASRRSWTSSCSGRAPRRAATSIAPRCGSSWPKHRAGRASHGDALWLLVNLEIWQRIFLRRRSARPR